MPQATKRFNDDRVNHYWDKKGELVKAYSRLLETDRPVWDTFFLFDRDTEWKEPAPVPGYWMDQIGLAPQHEFDGERLAAETSKLLQSTK